MIHNYVHGQWETALLHGQGPIKVAMTSHEAATLMAHGAAVAVKRPGGERGFLVLPPGALSEAQPLRLSAQSATGVPFSGHATVDVTLTDATGTEHYFRANPVAGQVAAPLMELHRAGDEIRVRPGEGGNATYGLGGWCVKRREEQGEMTPIAVDRIVIDTSRSMRRYAGHANALLAFIEDVCSTAGSTMPPVERPGLVRATADWVGAIDVATPSGRVIVVTDVPSAHGVDHLIIGDPMLLEVMLTPRAFAPQPQAWDELMREDAAYSDITLSLLTPLLTWLGDATQKKGMNA